MLNSNVAVIVWKTTPVGEGQSKSLHRRPLPKFMTSSGQGASVRSWCDGSSDRSFMVDPLSYFSFQGVRYSSVVRAFAHDAMGRRFDPSWWTLSYFSFQPVLHDWCNKDRGMCYPICGMMHIKETLLFIGKSSLYGGSGFPFSLSEWSLTICLTPYNRK